MLLEFEKKKKISNLLMHGLLGFLIFLPALYFIFPPSDSGLNLDYWMSKLDGQHLRIISKTPLRVFIPIPAWWEQNFWNTQFLLQLQGNNSVLRFITLLLSITTLVIVGFVLKDNKRSFILFVTNLLLIFIVAFIFPLTTQRYIGFIYIGFIVALWMYCYEMTISRRSMIFINALLIIQVIAGVFTVSKDIQLPFSNSDKVNELTRQVPLNEKIVTDFWCVNTISAFSDKIYYCIGLDREVNFLQWKKEFDTKTSGVYLKSIKKLFESEKLSNIYLISTYSPQIIFQIDSQVKNYFRFEMIGKRTGAIEKWSNLYLYRISPIENGGQ